MRLESQILVLARMKRGLILSAEMLPIIPIKVLFAAPAPSLVLPPALLIMMATVREYARPTHFPMEMAIAFVPCH
jgi:hypothetical protein